MDSLQAGPNATFEMGAEFTRREIMPHLQQWVHLIHRRLLASH